METRRVVKGNHTRKTAAFVRACVAYCFITIPSLSGVLPRLNLYLISGRVAVANGALSQGDAFFKAATNTLKDVPPTMGMCVSFVPAFVASSKESTSLCVGAK